MVTLPTEFRLGSTTTIVPSSRTEQASTTPLANSTRHGPNAAASFAASAGSEAAGTAGPPVEQSGRAREAPMTSRIRERIITQLPCQGRSLPPYDGHGGF